MYEKYIDWNNKVMYYKDFEEIFRMAGNSIKNLKRKSTDDPKVLFERYNCNIISEKRDFLIIVPFDRRCTYFINSYNCGGEGARWCIGNKRGSFWDDYMREGKIFYLIYFVKKDPFFGKKIMVEYNIAEDGFWWAYFQNDKIVDFSSLGYLLCHNYKQRKDVDPLRINHQLRIYYNLWYEKNIAKQLYFDFYDVQNIKTPAEMANKDDLLTLLIQSIYKEGYK
jgi:hypothetical protein